MALAVQKHKQCIPVFHCAPPPCSCPPLDICIDGRSALDVSPSLRVTLVCFLPYKHSVQPEAKTFSGEGTSITLADDYVIPFSCVILTPRPSPCPNIPFWFWSEGHNEAFWSTTSRPASRRRKLTRFDRVAALRQSLAHAVR